jgi:hypothetical protein
MIKHSNGGEASTEKTMTHGMIKEQTKTISSNNATDICHAGNYTLINKKIYKLNTSEGINYCTLLH